MFKQIVHINMLIFTLYVYQHSLTQQQYTAVWEYPLTVQNSSFRMHTSTDW